MKTKLAALTIAALLAACGGGGGGSASTTPATDTVTNGVTTTVNTSGAAAIAASNATSTAYNLVADIGDSWQVNFDTSTNRYAITVIASQFGLTSNSTNTTGAFTASTSGTFTTYTLGSAGTLTVDSRTKAIYGTLTIGTKSATVAGTGYKLGALAGLAGTYNFAKASRNASDGNFKEVLEGQIQILANGTASVCAQGTFNASNVCTALVSGTTPSTATWSLAVAADFPSTVIVTDTATNNVFGRLNFHVSDFGNAFVIDQYGVNAQNVVRVGSWYAVKSQTLKNTELNGTWACSYLGGSSSTQIISGTNVSTSSGNSGTVGYNQVSAGSVYATANGFANEGATSDPIASRTNVLPISSSFFVVEQPLGNGNLVLKTCFKQP